jgi:fumarate hydratase subunit beta
MDAYTEELLQHGIKGMIGKGDRSLEVAQAIARYGAVYLITVGGAGAYLAQRSKSAEVVAYADLGPEAIMRLEIVDLPCLVAIDACGVNIYSRQ